MKTKQRHFMLRNINVKQKARPSFTELLEINHNEIKLFLFVVWSENSRLPVG